MSALSLRSACTRQRWPGPWSWPAAAWWRSGNWPAARRAQTSFWGGYLLVPLYFLRRLAAWPVSYLTVTDKRMVLTGGLLIRTAAFMPLEKVTGLTLQRTVLGRLFGYGTLIVTSDSRHQPFRKVRYLPYPEQLYLEISGLLPQEGQGDTNAISQQAGDEGMTAQDSAGPFQQE